MARHMREGPAPRERRPFGRNFASVGGCETNPTPSENQTELLNSLRKFQLFKLAAHTWDATGRRGPMPQPRDFRIDLADMTPGEFHWGSA